MNRGDVNDVNYGTGCTLLTGYGTGTANASRNSTFTGPG